MQVSFSDGTHVTLKPAWTHGTQKAFDLDLFQDGTDVTAKGLHAAYEAAFDPQGRERPGVRLGGPFHDPGQP